MKNAISSILVIFVTVLIQSRTSYSQVMWQVSSGKQVKWYYNGGDEFTGNTLDTAKWLTSYPWGRSLYCNKEQEYYTENGNIEMQNGFLTLVTKKEPLSAKVLHWESDDHILKCNETEVGKNKQSFNFTSGMIYSTQKYHYGYYEIKFRSDEGKGLWPAFWLYAGHENDEIDIFEIKGERNNDIHVDIHCPSGCKNYKTALGMVKKNWGDYLSASSAWHSGLNVIGLEWNPEYIKWYLNGKGIAYWKGKMEFPAAIIANLAIPSNDGPFGPGPDATTNFPARFQIDYIRMWTSKQNSVMVTELEPVLSGSQRASIPVGNSQLTKRPKPEFKKSALKDEFVNVIFSLTSNNGAFISIVGKPSNDFFIEVKDVGQNVVYSSNDPKLKEHHFYFSDRKRSGTVFMKINGQNIEHKF